MFTKYGEKLCKTLNMIKCIGKFAICFTEQDDHVVTNREPYISSCVYSLLIYGIMLIRMYVLKNRTEQNLVFIST